MKTKIGLKKFVRKFSWLVNYFPFVNKFRLGGAKRFFSNQIFIRCKFISKGKDNIVRFNGNGGFKKTRITIIGNNNSVEFASGVSMVDGDILLEGNNNHFYVEGNTKFCGKIHVAIMESTKVKIGADGLFSSDVTIRTGDSHSILNMDGERINCSKDIEIGNHVWVGNHVIITKGAQIGNNSIIGTGSVVTKKHEENNVVIAGSPAQIVKRDVNWGAERI